MSILGSRPDSGIFLTRSQWNVLSSAAEYAEIKCLCTGSSSSPSTPSSRESISESSWSTLDDRQRACEPEEFVCEVEVTYEAAVVEDDCEICCCRGEGDAMREKDEPERTETGDVCVRI